MTAEELNRALAEATGREPPVLHICRERDVGLFSMVQQVVANIPWALREGRVPIAHLGERICYWTPAGYHHRDSVWEYYFEPLVDGFPVGAIPAAVQAEAQERFPEPDRVGYPVGQHAFVSNHFGDHPDLAGKALSIPYESGNPDADLRAITAELIGRFVRPRAYIAAKVDAFLLAHMSDGPVIGVHVRGTDAVSASEQRAYRQGSLDLDRYIAAIGLELERMPDGKVLVATDAQSSLDALRQAFGARVIAYASIRHEDGEAAGQGPTGWIMPAYIAADRDKAAQNGEEAVVEYLLLSRCQHLIHNGASLAATVLLAQPGMAHTNTHHRA